MSEFERKNKKRAAETEAAQFDPIALTLALWLGLVVTVTGLMRLSENAAANARAQQEAHAAALSTNPASARPSRVGTSIWPGATLAAAH